MKKWMAAGITALSLVTSLSAYPLDQELIGPVQAPNSDAQAQAYSAFSSNVYSYVGTVTSPFSPTATSAVEIISDPVNVLSNADATVRIYWVSNDAAYQNTIGFSPSGSLSSGGNTIVFPNASVNATVITSPSDTHGPYAGLVSGSFVDLGVLTQGTPFNLFIGADAANGTPQGVYWVNSALNADGTHVKVVHFIGTDYYLIGWEDLPLATSDLDFNDVYLVAEIVSAPEPMTYIIFGALAAVVLFARSPKTIRAEK